MENENNELMIIDSVEDLKLNKLISSLCPWKQCFAKKIRSFSGDQNLHDMLNNESIILVNKERSILETLCHYCHIVKSILKCSLKFRITSDLLMNIDNKLIISYSRLQEMMDFDRLNLFKILTKYDQIEENKLDEDDRKIYEEFTKGNGKHRLRFESKRENAVRKFADKIANFSSICSDENKLMIKTSLETLTYHDKDRIIDVLNTMKNYEKYPEVIERAFNFACKCSENPSLQLSDFINHIEFALALYKNEYEKMRHEIPYAHGDNGGKRFMKPTKLRKAVHINRPRSDLWKSVLINVQADKEWQKWNRNITAHQHLILNSPDIKMHNCKIPTMHEPKFCNLLIGFSSISSFLYHFMKHSSLIKPDQYIQMAMRFISNNNVEVQTRFTQNGNGRIITICSEMLEDFIIIAISNDGKANILTYIPDFTKQN